MGAASIIKEKTLPLQCTNSNPTTPHLFQSIYFTFFYAQINDSDYYSHFFYKQKVLFTDLFKMEKKVFISSISFKLWWLIAKCHSNAFRAAAEPSNWGRLRFGGHTADMNPLLLGMCFALFLLNSTVFTVWHSHSLITSIVENVISCLYTKYS